MKKIVDKIRRLDYENKTLVKNSGTVVLNGIVGIGKLLIGIYLMSDWFVVNALYYLALAAAKGRVLKQYKQICLLEKQEEQYLQETCIFRGNGGLQCLVGITYFFVSLHMFLANETEIYPDYLIYVVVLIAFGKIGFAFYGIFQMKRIHNPVTAVLKIIDFTDALVSIVVARSVLQTMKHVETAATSSGIFGMGCSVLFVVVGIFMLVYSHSKSKDK